MYFSPKKSIARASLILIFATPVFAYADPDVPAAPDSSVDTSAHYLTLSEAQTAFDKTQFSTKMTGDTVTLYGGTSISCAKSFDVTNFPDKGQFKIYYRGDNPSCLNFNTAVKGLKRGDFQSLNDLADGKMDATGTFSKVTLASENITSSKNPIQLEEIPVDGSTDANPTSISHTSAADIAQKNKDAAATRQDAQNQLDLLVMTQCQGNLDSIDASISAFERISKQMDIVKEQGGQKWVDANKANIESKKFSACRTGMLKYAAQAADDSDPSRIDLSGYTFVSPMVVKPAAKKNQWDSGQESECETFVDKFSGQDAKSLAKVKSLYMSLMNADMSNSSKGIQGGLQATLDDLAKLQSLVDADPNSTDADQKNLEAMERNINLHFLHAASSKGTNSDDFQFMKGKFLDYIAGVDKGQCLNDQTGGVLPSATPAAFAACSDMRSLSLQINQQAIAAAGVQSKVDATMKFQAEQQTCVNERQMAPLTGVAMSDAETKKCNDIDAAAAKIAGTTTDTSLGSGSGGFGVVADITNATAAASTPAKTSTTTSGLLNTGYGTNTTNTANTINNVTPNFGAPTQAKASGQKVLGRG